MKDEDIGQTRGAMHTNHHDNYVTLTKIIERG